MHFRFLQRLPFTLQLCSWSQWHEHLLPSRWSSWRWAHFTLCNYFRPPVHTMTVVSACPSGTSPYINFVTGLPQGCIAGAVYNCPSGNSCVMGTAGQYLCCQRSTNFGCKTRCARDVSLACYWCCCSLPKWSDTLRRVRFAYSRMLYIDVYLALSAWYVSGTVCRTLCGASPPEIILSSVSVIIDYFSATTGRPVLCSTGSTNSGCPSGYACVRGTSSSFLCCRGTVVCKLKRRKSFFERFLL